MLWVLSAPQVYQQSRDWVSGPMGPTAYTQQVTIGSLRVLGWANAGGDNTAYVTRGLWPPSRRAPFERPVPCF